MSTIFGALFFVILILMGFNVMLWGFVQLDAYNSVITKMSQRDQQAISENLVPTNSTCDSTCKLGSGTLFVWMTRRGCSPKRIRSQSRARKRYTRTRSSEFCSRNFVPRLSVSL